MSSTMLLMPSDDLSVAHGRCTESDCREGVGAVDVETRKQKASRRDSEGAALDPIWSSGPRAGTVLAVASLNSTLDSFLSSGRHLFSLSRSGVCGTVHTRCCFSRPRQCIYHVPCASHATLKISRAASANPYVFVHPHPFDAGLSLPYILRSHARYSDTCTDVAI